MSKKITSFDEVVGHKNLVAFLKKHIEQDNLGQVIVFHGNSGLGKSSLAKLTAVAITTRYKDEKLKQEYMKAVIEENKDTDSIKLFNMSTMEDKEAEIQRVIAEMSTAFSSTGRKVLILDEAHNMSKRAQDSILTMIDPPPENVYIFICTTEVGTLSETLRGRGKAVFRLNNLSNVEAREVAERCIRNRALSFDMDARLVISQICDWANNQPRKICNLFDNFERGSRVSVRDLELFIDVTLASVIIECLKYLYGDMALGINYLSSMQYDETFVSMLIEVTKVALGHKSTAVSPREIAYIEEFMEGKDVNHLIKFTADVAGLSYLRKRNIVAAFMKNHVLYNPGVSPRAMSDESARLKDLAAVNSNVKTKDVDLAMSRETAVPSIEELFENAPIAEVLSDVKGVDVPVIDGSMQGADLPTINDIMSHHATDYDIPQYIKNLAKGDK